MPNIDQLDILFLAFYKFLRQDIIVNEYFDYLCTIKTSIYEEEFNIYYRSD